MVVRVEMHYSRRRRSSGGWLEGTSPACLLPAIAKVKEDWGFWLGRKKRTKGVVANGSMKGLLDQWLLFIGQIERMDWL